MLLILVVKKSGGIRVITILEMKQLLKPMGLAQEPQTIAKEAWIGR